jgi:hypothetical protein
MGLLARLSQRRRSIISLDCLNHGNPCMHDEIASFRGASQAGSRVLNLRIIMLGFRDGLAQNKFLAKLASDHRKPNGQFVITLKMRPAFVQDLPVGKIHGIGPAASAKMNGLGIFTGMDMRNQTLKFVNAHFGKAGSNYWISHGIDERRIRANWIRKFVGAENVLAGFSGL